MSVIRQRVGTYGQIPTCARARILNSLYVKCVLNRASSVYVIALQTVGTQYSLFLYICVAYVSLANNIYSSYIVKVTSVTEHPRLANL